MPFPSRATCHPDERGQNEAGDAWDQTYQSIRPTYFDRVDQRIEHLLDMGFIPNIVGLWGYYMKFMGLENVEKHWQYIIARYGAYPVTFTLSGETTLAYYSDLAENWEHYKKEFRQQWSEVARFIQQNDPYDRLLTTHPGPGIHDGKNPIDSMQFLDMIMLQSGHRGFETVPFCQSILTGLQETVSRSARHSRRSVFRGHVWKQLARCKTTFILE